MGYKKRKTVEEFGTVSFLVLGPIPRTAPYKQGFRGRLFVPDDTKAWRKHIAFNFLKAGGRKPKDTEQPYSEFRYLMVANHADLDSITHSAQDGLTKDALKCDDKEWWGKYYRNGEAESHDKEATHITVQYLKKESNG